MFSSRAFAEDLTLERALDEAQRNSPDLAQAQSVAEELAWKKLEVMGMGFFPKVQLKANHFFLNTVQYAFSDVALGDADFKIPNIFPNNNATLDVSVPLFDGLANLAYTQAADLNVTAAELQLQYAKLQIQNATKTAFYQALAAEALLLVAQQNIQTMESHLKQVRAQSSGGVTTQIDVLRVQVQLEEAKSDLESAQDDRVLARKRLLKLMACETDSFDKLVGELPIPSSLSWDEVVSRADIEAQVNLVNADQKILDAKSRWWVPTISLVGEVGYYNLLKWNNGVQDLDHYRWSHFVGLNLSWNLFDGAIAISAVHQAFARKMQNESRLQNQRLSADLDCQIYERKYKTNAKKYLAKRLNLQRSEESVRLTQDEYGAGTRTITDVLDASADLFRARAGVITTQLESEMALLQYELALGKTKR